MCVPRLHLGKTLPSSHAEPHGVRERAATCKHTNAAEVLTFSQLLLQHLQLLLCLGQGDRGCLTAAKEGRASGAERQEAGWS